MGIWKCGRTGLSHQTEGDKERYGYTAIGVFLLPHHPHRPEHCMSPKWQRTFRCPVGVCHLPIGVPPLMEGQQNPFQLFLNTSFMQYCECLTSDQVGGGGSQVTATAAVQILTIWGASLPAGRWSWLTLKDLVPCHMPLWAWLHCHRPLLQSRNGAVWILPGESWWSCVYL